jgi:hypothetical protein
MTLGRVTFKGDVFIRKTEDDKTWETKSHKGETPLASGCFEITGEKNPEAIRDMSVISDLTIQKSFVYHYSWTLGINGRDLDWLNKLDEEEALLVQIIIQCGQSRFVSREIFATLEYLPPTKNLIESPNFLEWGKKILTNTGDIAKNAGFKIGGSIVSSIANIIPPDKKDDVSRWYLKKFAFPVDSGENKHIYGTEWFISRKLILEIGSRFIGRLGVVFLDAPIQEKEDNPADNCIYLRGRFGLKHKAKHNAWYDYSMLPAWDSEELKLKITPK